MVYVYCLLISLASSVVVNVAFIAVIRYMVKEYGAQYAAQFMRGFMVQATANTTPPTQPPPGISDSYTSNRAL